MPTKHKTFLSLFPPIVQDSFNRQCDDKIHNEILSLLMKLDIDTEILDEGLKSFYDVSSGRIFEYYVESLIDKKYWKVVSWRGDKFQKLYCKEKDKEKELKPESNSYPDIIIEFTSDTPLWGFKKEDRVAIECKWKNHKEGMSLAECALEKFEGYRDNSHYLEKALNDNASCFYYAIGVGYKISRKQLKPEAIYLIPASETNNTPDLSKYKVKKKLRLNRRESLISNKLDYSTYINTLRNSYARLNRLMANLPKAERDSLLQSIFKNQ